MEYISTIGYDLPEELWNESFTYLGIRAHKRLSQTCRRFRRICLPFVFKTATLDASCDLRRGSAYSQAELEGKVAKCASLGHSKIHSPLIQQLRLDYRLMTPSTKDQAHVSSTKGLEKPTLKPILESLLPLFPNLRSLTLRYNRVLDKGVLSTLTAHPNIEELRFVQAKFSAHQMKPRLKPRKLTILNPQADCNPNKNAKFLDVFSGERLEDLSITSWVYTPKILMALTRQSNSSCLKSLSIQLLPEDFPVLAPFLKICPNLENLALNCRSMPGRHSRFPGAELSAIPVPIARNLRNISGPDEAIKVFVPGRPVKKVFVHYERIVFLTRSYLDNGPREYEEMLSLMPYLSQSTGPVLDLHIELAVFEPNLLALISIYTPHLTSLTLEMGPKSCFPDEDPYNSSFDTIVTEVRNGDEQELSDLLLPVARHAGYMEIMHWVALGKIEIPANLEILTLRHKDFGFRFEDCREESLLGRHYTVSMAHSIFSTLSMHYPAMRKIYLQSPDNHTNAFWYIRQKGIWEFSGFPKRPSSYHPLRDAYLNTSSSICRPRLSTVHPVEHPYME